MNKACGQNGEKMKKININKSYTSKTNFWRRSQKSIQSDFICRPQVFQLVGNVKGKTLVDIGCGEGYTCRWFAQVGAKVTGLEFSQGMVEAAQQQEKREELGIVYVQGDARKLQFESESFEVAVSVLVMGHFNKSGVKKATQEAARVLKSGGLYVLAIPHPMLCVNKMQSGWVGFSNSQPDYWKEEDRISLFRAGSKDGFEITIHNHTFSTIVTALINGGFEVEAVCEPKPTKKDLAQYPQMWGMETNLPAYMIIRARKK